MNNAKDDTMYDINNKLDEIRTLFYNLLDFSEEDFSPAKERAKREVNFAINDLKHICDRL